jgi:hypothetical protein
MPTSYLDSSPPPEISINDWLGWSSNDLEIINNNDTYIAALVGINWSGNVQNIFKLIPIKDDSDKTKAIIGNSSQYKTKPNFVYVKLSDLGSVYLMEKLSKMPPKIRPTNPLPKTYLSSTVWEDTTDIGICLIHLLTPIFFLIPLLALIFFGQKTIEGSVTDKDFVDKMAAISPKHGTWADLMKETFNQLKENECDIEKSLTVSKSQKGAMSHPAITRHRLLPPTTSLNLPTFFFINSQTQRSGSLHSSF